MLFDYYCPKCNFILEDYMTWQKEDEWIPCPKCGETMVKKIPVVNVKVRDGTPRFYERGKKKEK